MRISTLKHTWIFDIDGTIVKHNGYIIDGHDTLLDGVSELFAKIPQDDCIILLTAREQKVMSDLEQFLESHNIRYDYLLCEIPLGERILINDIKPSGLKTAFAINKERNGVLDIDFEIDEGL